MFGCAMVHKDLYIQETKRMMERKLVSNSQSGEKNEGFKKRNSFLLNKHPSQNSVGELYHTKKESIWKGQTIMYEEQKSECTKG